MAGHLTEPMKRAQIRLVAIPVIPRRLMKLVLAQVPFRKANSRLKPGQRLMDWRRMTTHKGPSRPTCQQAKPVSGPSVK